MTYATTKATTHTRSTTIAKPPPITLIQRIGRILPVGGLFGWTAVGKDAGMAGDGAGVDATVVAAAALRRHRHRQGGWRGSGRNRGRRRSSAGCGSRLRAGAAAAAAARVSMLKLKAGPSLDIRSTSPERIRVRPDMPDTTVWLISSSPLPVQETYQPSSNRRNRAVRPLAAESCRGSKKISQFASLPTRNSVVSKTIRSPARMPDKMKISALIFGESLAIGVEWQLHSGLPDPSATCRYDSGRTTRRGASLLEARRIPDCEAHVTVTRTELQDDILGV